MELWWIFPVSVSFATVAISSGVSGALFFSPFFMLVLGLSPAQAIGAGLLTEVFGMGNGLRLYIRQRVVDYTTARWVLMASIPTVVIGALGAHLIPGDLLKVIFGVGLVLLSGSLIFNQTPGADDAPCGDGDALDPECRRIEAADGREYWIPKCHPAPAVILAAVGGLLTGLISAGLPELNTTQMVVRCRIPPRVAVATSVFALALTAVVGAGVHALSAAPAWHIVQWSIPGVLVGSYLGTRIGPHLPAALMEKLLGFVFAAVGLLVLGIQFFT